jgi:hypothetical protein
MSSEGKKKRGEAGVSNARNIAFRYGGSKCDLSTKIGSTQHPRLAGAKLLHTTEFAQILPYFNPSDRLMKAVDATIDHLTLNHSRTVYARDWQDAA